MIAIKEAFKKSILEASLADKITFLTFIGTALTCTFSAVMFLPSLENRVEEIENQIKILPKDIDKLRLDAAHLEEAAKNSEKLRNELDAVKSKNDILTGKVEMLENFTSKR